MSYTVFWGRVFQNATRTQYLYGLRGRHVKKQTIYNVFLKSGVPGPREKE